MLIIDGHNLIPNIPGLSLHQIDDEQQLIDLLKEYARIKRKQIEVFFDGSPPGQPAERVYGSVRVHFVQIGTPADDAIRLFISRLGKHARNCTLITSDRMVQANGRSYQAQIRNSEDFAQELISIQNGKTGSNQTGSSTEPPVDRDISQWLELFAIDPAQAAKPIEPQKEKTVVKKISKTQCITASKKRPHHGFEKKQ
jgi:uncharacterized protein